MNSKSHLSLASRTAAATFAAALTFVGASSVASASPIFPPVVKQTFSLSSEPACTLCHNSLSGGLGTAVTPVGTYLRSRGAVAADTTALKGALAAMLAEKHDADGDGVTDVDELKAGTDPNGSGGYGEPPAFGCGARIATGRSTSGAFAALIGLVGVLAVRRRKAAPR